MTKRVRNKKRGERNKDRERKERENFLNLSTQIGGASS